VEELILYQQNLLGTVDDQFTRFLYPQLSKERRMLAIKGLRGAGKTTLLLQYLKFGLKNNQQALYVTMDHPWFYTHGLLDLAREFHSTGGTHLFIDEVHKYPNWSRELKNIYDGFPNVKIIFTASSALDIYRGESDLSRRVITYELPGMSFREYLEMIHKVTFNQIPFMEILENHSEHTIRITQKMGEILPLFHQYLKNGYLPFAAIEDEKEYLTKIYNVINASLTSDLAFIEHYSAAHIVKLKTLLGVLAESVPFEPNISAIAQKLNLGRETVIHFLQSLEKARLLNLLNKSTKGIAALQKPDKIYLENTNFSYALKSKPDVGTIRETFFLNQIRNAGLPISQATKGDFLVDEKWTFEIGGKGKSTTQIKEVKNAFIVSDQLERGALNRIPLWLFGFLY
jgi:predicted AAA+ superfamily ATPase